MNDHNLRLCVVVTILRAMHHRKYPDASRALDLDQFVAVLCIIHDHLDKDLGRHLGSFRPQSLIEPALSPTAVPVDRIMKLVDDFLRTRTKERT